MIKLSTGVELSEDTVVSALKKAGINVEPKHVFEAGDVAYQYGKKERVSWRLIVKIDRRLIGIDMYGIPAGSYDQEQFEYNDYKYAGKQTDLLNNN